MFTWFQYLEQERNPDTSDSMEGAYLGPSWTQNEIESWISRENLNATFHDNDRLYPTVAQYIANGRVVGWFQDRMEFGPRALGNRSILGDPRSEEMQKVLNLKIKFRESFRPFAPSVLEGKVSDYFDFKGESPYMLMVANVEKTRLSNIVEQKIGFEKLYQKRSELPAITHVDNSARIQTVSKKTNPKYHTLISEFEKLTGCPVLINTSFNVRGEPIVCTPSDAYRCFMRTNMDVLVVGNHVFLKEEQPVQNHDDYWKNEFVLD